jgi:transposase InsO family protein
MPRERRRSSALVHRSAPAAEDNSVKERLGGWRLRFMDVERRRLARRAYALGQPRTSSRAARLGYLLHPFCNRSGESHGEDCWNHRHPDEVWMMQMARNFTDVEEPFLRHARFLIMDRDTKYSATFRAALARERVEAIRLPPRSPNLNAYAERFVRLVNEECTGRMIFLGSISLERALAQYMVHYHEERNHQGLQNRLLNCPGVRISRAGRVKRRERLGGMLSFYHREVA